MNNPFFYTEIYHFKFVKIKMGDVSDKFVKKNLGDVSDTPTMMRMKLCLDHYWITMTVGLDH